MNATGDGDARMALNSEKSNRITASGLRFFFAPQLGISLLPAKAIFSWFVQILAQFLYSAALIPNTHKALRPMSVKDARLGELLAIAWSNARKPGTRIDQRAVLLSVWMLLGLTTLMILHTIGNLVLGTAHASLAILGTALVCSFSGPSTSYFEAPCASDMAQDWISMLLLGQTTGWFVPQFSSVGMINGLSNMFSTYSIAMMTVAGFLILYNLLSAVAGTAADGRFGGKSMNQVWAPIRLIFAIALLVPLGTGGMNMGQMMVVRIAQAGSGLGSNIWLAFADGFAANTGAYLIAPPLPQVSPMLRNALKILVCDIAYDDSGQMSQNAKFSSEVSEWHPIPGAPYEEISWDFKNNNSGINDGQSKACGSVQVPVAADVSQGSANEFFGSMSTLASAPAVRQAMIEAHKDALIGVMSDGNMKFSNNAIAPEGPLHKLAQNFFDSSNGSISGYELTFNDLLQFNAAVLQYRASLGSGIMTAMAAIGITTLSMKADAMARGWVSASVWFNSIARINGMLLDYSQEIPVATPPDGEFPGLSEQSKEVVRNALENVDVSIAGLPALAMQHNITTWGESGYTLAIDGSGVDNSFFKTFLKLISSNFGKILGTGSESPDEITAPVPSAIAGIAGKLSLNSANPLAELSALGHRIIQMTFITMATLQQCSATAEAQRNELNTGLNAIDNKEQREQVKNIYSNLNVDNGCGSTSFGTNDNMGSVFMSMIVGTMLSAGVTLAFILPMIPFIRFMFGILTWLLSLFETVIAIPVVALAHVKMDGEGGLAGPSARTAYLLMLQLFLRPTLMIFGLIIALLIFNIMIVALNEFYSGAVRSVQGGGALSAVGGIMYTIMYASLAYALANASFKAIDLIPNRVLNWIGGGGGATADEMHTVTSAVSRTTDTMGTFAQMTNKASNRIAHDPMSPMSQSRPRPQSPA